MKIVVVIPIYRNPSTDEITSLRRCCQVLSRYDMALVCPSELDISVYSKIWSEYGLCFSEERFAEKYFQDIAGYNRLLLSEEFYARFSAYDYMLIYQPDAYVFEDNLEEWCNKGYDYIGAPVFGRFEDTEFHPNQVWVGNGGFSLRKIDTFISYFHKNDLVIPIKHIASHIHLKDKVYTRWLVWFMMACGWRNRPKSFAAHCSYNEDCFWCNALQDTQYRLNIPQSREAMDFAIERFPHEVYEITGKLPLGVHAWRKYEYETFWRDIMR